MSCAVMLPGSGSDERFIRSVFGAALAGIGVEVVAPSPRPGADVVTGYREALDAAGPAPTEAELRGLDVPPGPAALVELPHRVRDGRPRAAYRPGRGRERRLNAGARRSRAIVPSRGFVVVSGWAAVPGDVTCPPPAARVPALFEEVGR